ncbi:MAG TPA: DEAD/DEAH box helicase [Prolixibacteraceae bacterium]|nr:DEAD/DEAH box helicase [Prolixibacteraceae bacterium]
MTFTNLGIIEPILRALTAEGYQTPTPIQEQAIPILLRGKDLLGCAQTGTGKTAAFAIPILQHLYMERQQNNHMRKIRALVVTPTRELALQIGESFTTYGKFTGIKNAVIYGGVKQGAQVTALEAGVDVLVATPGRLLDLMDQGYVSLDHIGWSVLDEADRMLDMGFIHDIRKIIARLPQKRQSLFFSATMPPEIVELSRKILGNPEKVSIQPEQTTAEKVKQSVYMVTKKRKPALLIHLLKQNPGMAVLVFTRTKHGADKVVRILKKSGIEAAAIHGNKSQGARQQALGNFKSGRSGVLVATDIAARGIDIEELPLVINFDIPNIPETYVHRIGRTARAGMEGEAISFCDAEEIPWLKDIQKLIRQTVPVVEEHPFMGDGEDATEEETPAFMEVQEGRSVTASRGRDSSGDSSWRRQSGNTRAARQAASPREQDSSHGREGRSPRMSEQHPPRNRGRFSPTRAPQTPAEPSRSGSRKGGHPGTNRHAPSSSTPSRSSSGASRPSSTPSRSFSGPRRSSSGSSRSSSATSRSSSGSSPSTPSGHRPAPSSTGGASNGRSASTSSGGASKGRSSSSSSGRASSQERSALRDHSVQQPTKGSFTDYVKKIMGIKRG